MVIVHSYVSLPEGIDYQTRIQSNLGGGLQLLRSTHVLGILGFYHSLPYYAVVISWWSPRQPHFKTNPHHMVAINS